MPNLNCSCADGFYGNLTLAEIRSDVIVGLGYAAQVDNPPPGMSALVDFWVKGAHKYLYRKYRALHTKRYYSWDMNANERLYGIKASRSSACGITLDPTRIAGVWVEDPNGTFTPLRRGIPATYYTSIANPGIPWRYEIRQCLEVFPAPPSTGYTLWVLAHFLMPFESDDDVSTIDSELVTQWALARGKGHYRQADAKDVAAQANDYLRDLVRATHTGQVYVPNMIELPPETMPVFLPLQDS